MLNTFMPDLRFPWQTNRRRMKELQPIEQNTTLKSNVNSLSKLQNFPKNDISAIKMATIVLCLL